jgi:hypothetical protein
MNPYITWSKVYQTRNISEDGKESWRARWLLSMYEVIATKLYAEWQPEMRFNDEEKAQLFIGYLSKFPKKVESKNPSIESVNQSEEVQDYE